jgi:hypothetical protein
VFRFKADSVPIEVGQSSGLMSDSFPMGSEGCPVWSGTVSDIDRMSVRYGSDWCPTSQERREATLSRKPP